MVGFEGRAALTESRGIALVVPRIESRGGSFLCGDFRFDGRPGTGRACSQWRRSRCGGV